MESFVLDYFVSVKVVDADDATPELVRPGSWWGMRDGCVGQTRAGERQCYPTL